jgi:hypothetical protein
VVIGGAATMRGAADVGVVVHGATGGDWATGGAAGVVEAARGRNLGGTIGADKEATSGSKPRGTTGVG